MKKNCRIINKILCVLFALILGLCSFGCTTIGGEEETFNVGVIGGVGGAINVKSGTALTLTATIPEGQEFVNWTENEQIISTENPFVYEVSKSTTIVANFVEPSNFTIVVENGTGGGVDLEKGSSISIVATIPQGKKFVNWTEGSTVVSTQNPYVFEVEKNRTITANFADLESYTISVVGGVSTKTSVLEGESVTISPTVPDDKKFVRWVVGTELFSSQTMYTFVPTSNLNISAVFEDMPQRTIVFDTNGGVVTNDVDLVQTISSGDSIEVPTLSRQFYTYTWDKTIKKDNVTESATYSAIWTITSNTNVTLPIVRLTTNDNYFVTSKTEYKAGTATVQRADKTYDTQNAPMQIRGRGNSSFYTVPESGKRSFKIKFDEKTSLFDMPKAKDWVLISNVFDRSLLRNYLAYDLSQKMDNLIFSPLNMMVEVYFNNSYFGVYLLCEHVEQGKGRINLDKNYNDGDSEVDYLVEMNFRLGSAELSDLVRNEDYFTMSGQNMHPIEVKYPDPKDELSPDEFNYIKADVRAIHEDILSNDFSRINSAIDVDSFIDYFMIQELFKNPDAGQGSLFYSKQVGQKLVASPVWDFDISLGNGQMQWNEPWSVENAYVESAAPKNAWFSALMQNRDFRSRYVARWNVVYATYIQEAIDSFDTLYDIIKPYATKNFERWNYLTNPLWADLNLNDVKTYDGQIEFLFDFYEGRSEWLNEYYN